MVAIGRRSSGPPLLKSTFDRIGPFRKAVDIIFRKRLLAALQAKLDVNRQQFSEEGVATARLERLEVFLDASRAIRDDSG